MISPRVLFLSLDAADPQLISQWCDEGVLPTLQRLRDEAAWGPVEHAPGLYTGTAWPSIATGVNPGRHGIYFCEQLTPGSYETEIADGRDFKAPPIWEALSDAGRRLAIIDVPKAPVVDHLNGVHLVDWTTHDADVPTCSYPEDFAEEMMARFGRDPVGRCDWVARGRDPERTLLPLLLERVRNKTALATHLLEREAWDLFALVFGDSHCAGHQFWHVHDPKHPRHDASLAAELGDPIRAIYIALDQAIGEILRAAGPHTTTVLLLSHGMGPHYDATFLLDDILRRLEGRSEPLEQRALKWARAHWRKLPVSVTEACAKFAGSTYRAPHAQERRKRRYFTVPTNSNAGGIRLNVRGREPDGQIDPGPEFDRVCNELERDLHELVNAETGQPLVKEVVRSERCYHGDALALLPDLVVRWHRSDPIHTVSSARVGVVEGEDLETTRTGDHQPLGRFYAMGPTIVPGEQAHPVKGEDIAATWATLLGVEVSDLDGSAIPCIVGNRR